MNEKVVSTKFMKKGLEFKTPIKWVVVFIGNQRYDSDFSLKNLIKNDECNFNLIIVGLNVESKDLCISYESLCNQTKEGFFVNIRTNDQYEDDY